jgi:hypothetical protein
VRLHVSNYYYFKPICFYKVLKRPCFKDGKVSENPDPKKALMTREEFHNFMKNDSKKYMWDNYLTDIETVAGEKKYKGQR